MRETFDTLRGRPLRQSHKSLIGNEMQHKTKSEMEAIKIRRLKRKLQQELRELRNEARNARALVRLTLRYKPDK